jgi:HK97 gp10 family phage protein
MGAKITMNIARFKEQLKAKAEVLNQATRPAAQAGAQIVYDRARELVPVSEAAHKFYGTHQVYGPYRPGTLRDAIYQAFSEDNSYRDVSVYHISWNKGKAPYGFMVEFGTSQAPANSFINRAIVETRQQVKAAMKQRYIEEVSSKR